MKYISTILNGMCGLKFVRECKCREFVNEILLTFIEGMEVPFLVHEYCNGGLPEAMISSSLFSFLVMLKDLGCETIFGAFWRESLMISDWISPYGLVAIICRFPACASEAS